MKQDFHGFTEQTCCSFVPLSETLDHYEDQDLKMLWRIVVLMLKTGCFYAPMPSWRYQNQYKEQLSLPGVYKEVVIAGLLRCRWVCSLDAEEGSRAAGVFSAFSQWGECNILHG
ncbi:unnamed protein product [Urochloa humidicola]